MFGVPKCARPSSIICVNLRGKAARLKELKTPRPTTKVKKVKTRGKKAKAAKAAAKKA